MVKELDLALNCPDRICTTHASMEQESIPKTDYIDLPEQSVTSSE